MADATMPTVPDVYARATRRRPGLTSRFLELDDLARTHVLETDGDEPPLLLLHGGGTSALSLLPLIDELDGLRVVAPDRPGFGLSESIGYQAATFRDAAVRFVGALLDRLGIERADLVGNSMGGTWSLWYALAFPDRVRRLVMLGAPPLTPDTRIPTPLRIMAAPGVGRLLSRVMPATPKSVRQMMGAFGEGDTIGEQPEVLGGLVAAAADDKNGEANLAETRAVMTALGGFRPALELSAHELGRLDVPVLLVFGDHDPVGGPEVGRSLAAALPDARLEALPTGHVPWLAKPDVVARHLQEFLPRTP